MANGKKINFKIYLVKRIDTFLMTMLSLTILVKYFSQVRALYFKYSALWYGNRGNFYPSHIKEK